MSDMVFVWAIGATVTWCVLLAYGHALKQKRIGFWWSLVIGGMCYVLWPIVLGTELGAALGKLSKEGRG